MATPRTVWAFSQSRDGNQTGPTEIQLVKTPYSPADITLTLTQALALGIDTKNLTTTHVKYLEQEHVSQETVPYKPLPEFQPVKPAHWSDEAWNNRFITGDSKFHVFSTDGIEEYVYLKVSDEKDHNRRWVYDHMHSRDWVQLAAFARKMSDGFESTRSVEPRG